MLRSRVMLAVIGLLLIGGTSASIAVLTASHPGSTVPGTAQGNPTASDGTATSTGGTPTATPLISSSPTLALPTQPVPTATQPGPPPATATPRPAPPPGQSVDLNGGRITAIDRPHNIITYRDTSGTIWTVTVSGSTQYPGVPYSLIEAGMLAEIQGQTTGGYNLLASSVDAHDN